MDWPTNRLQREITRLALLGLGAAVALGTVVGAAITVLLERRDQ